MELFGVTFAVVMLVHITLVLNETKTVSAQVSSLDLPVELIGFPIIVVAVRLSNFVKKLAYSLNPRTYSSRTRRSIYGDGMIDIEEAEKRLVSELGQNVCIYTRVCLYHAEKANRTKGSSDRQIVDWNDIFRNLSQLAILSTQNQQLPMHPENVADYYVRPDETKLAMMARNALQTRTTYGHYPSKTQGHFGFPHNENYYAQSQSTPGRYPSQYFFEALQAITQNDDLHCVPKLLCEFVSGTATTGAKQTSVLPFKFSMESLLPLMLSIFSGVNTTPLMHFGKAAILGYTSKGRLDACSDSYKSCPNDPDRLVEYLNNHNGGFFRFFNGIPPHGLSEQQYPDNYLQYDQQYIQQYPAFGHLPVQHEQFPQDNPNVPYYLQYNKHMREFPYRRYPYIYSQYYLKPNKAEKRIQNNPLLPYSKKQIPAKFQNLVFENDISSEKNNYYNMLSHEFVFPEHSKQNRGFNKLRKEKVLTFPANNEPDLEKPSPNHQISLVIFPVRTGTGELLLDSEELNINSNKDDNFVTFSEDNNAKHLHSLQTYHNDNTNPVLFRFPRRSED